MICLAAAMAALLLPGRLAAIEVGCPGDSRPLLRILDYWRTGPPLVPSESRGITLICTNGFVATSQVGDGSGHDLPTAGTIQIGTASPATMAELGAWLAEARVGIRSDCRFVVTQGLDNSKDITWFGRRGRTNRFIMGPDLSLPSCAWPAFQLFAAIEDVKQSATEDAPDSTADVSNR